MNFDSRLKKITELIGERDALREAGGGVWVSVSGEDFKSFEGYPAWKRTCVALNKAVELAEKVWDGKAWWGKEWPAAWKLIRQKRYSIKSYGTKEDRKPWKYLDKWLEHGKAKWVAQENPEEAKRLAKEDKERKRLQRYKDRKRNERKLRREAKKLEKQDCS